MVFWLVLKLEISYRAIIYLEEFWFFNGFWPLGNHNNNNNRSIFI
jgi:hypothetical protein